MTTQLIKIGYQNILENSSVIVSSENASYPAYRLYDRDIGKLFKPGSAAAFQVIIDQGDLVLLHFNGENGSTTFTDVFGHTWTAVGTAQLSMSGPKFGSARLLLDGDSDYITCTEIQSLGSLFCLEGWFHTHDKTQHDQALITANATGGYGLLLIFNYGGSGKMQLSASHTAGAGDIGTSAGTKNSWTNFQWYKWRLECDGSTYKLYIDGVLDISITSNLSICASLVNVNLGGNIGSQYLYGGMDEIRLRFGLYRDCADFVPEIAEFSDTIDPRYPVDCLVIPAGHSLNGLALTLQCSSDYFISEAIDAATWNQIDTLMINKSMTEYTKRYWRLLFTPTTVIIPGFAEMFLTKMYIFARNPSWGFTTGNRQNITRNETSSGKVRMIKNGLARREQSYVLAHIATAQKTALEAWETASDGNLKPIYVEDESGNIFFAEPISPFQFRNESEGRWGLNLNLLEVLA